ncbi:homoserine dehydrogenase, partial [Streptococcus thermophilus]|nr:homoserine dehydrogenase [Streptococcus thermophilus]
METIKIGVVGLGTVGTGVVKMLQAHQEKISEITGRKLELACVVVHNLKKHEQVDLGDVQMTDQIATLLDDPSIQIMVEVMGSIHPAKEYITQALQAGKHVVTANKDLIAQYGREL